MNDHDRAAANRPNLAAWAHRYAGLIIVILLLLILVIVAPTTSPGVTP